MGFALIGSIVADIGTQRQSPISLIMDLDRGARFLMFVVVGAMLSVVAMIVRNFIITRGMFLAVIMRMGVNMIVFMGVFFPIMKMFMLVFMLVGMFVRFVLVVVFAMLFIVLMTISIIVRVSVFMVMGMLHIPMFMFMRVPMLVLVFLAHRFNLSLKAKLVFERGNQLPLPYYNT